MQGISHLFPTWHKHDNGCCKTERPLQTENREQRTDQRPPTFVHLIARNFSAHDLAEDGVPTRITRGRHTSLLPHSICHTRVISDPRERVFNKNPTGCVRGRESSAGETVLPRVGARPPAVPDRRVHFPGRGRSAAPLCLLRACTSRVLPTGMLSTTNALASGCSHTALRVRGGRRGAAETAGRAGPARQARLSTQQTGREQGARQGAARVTILAPAAAEPPRRGASRRGAWGCGRDARRRISGPDARRKPCHNAPGERPAAGPKATRHRSSERIQQRARSRSDALVRPGRRRRGWRARGDQLLRRPTRLRVRGA